MGRYRLKRGDLLVCEGGEVGRAAIWTDQLPECYYQKALHRLRPQRGYDPRIMLALLEYWSSRNDFANFVTQTSFAHLPRDKFQMMPLPLIPLDEQERIAEVLDDFDGQVATLARLIAKKEAIKQGMMQQLLTGRTRLPGFTGAWEWRPFVDVMTRINAKRFQVPAHAYRSAGRLPVVDQGQRAVVGYIDDVSVAFDPGLDGVVVFGDHTCITKFVNFMFAVGADGTQILKASPGNSTRFMALALEASPVTSTGYNRHFKHLKEKVLPVPPLAEQDAIVEALADIDAAIDSLIVRLAKARGVKQGMMQELLTGRTRLPIKEVES